MSDNVLIPSAVPTAENESNAVALMKNVDYFPRLKLCQGNAIEVQERKIRGGGYYALIHSKDSLVDLGEEFEAVVADVRTKALRTGDEILQYFDPETEEFKQIIDESKIKDSDCMFGPEYLLWIPSESCFATLFLCSKSARRSAGDIHKRLGQAVTIGSTLIKTKSYSWYGNTYADCSAPVTNLPSGEDVASAQHRFRSEKSSEVKKAAPPVGTGREV